MFLECCSAFPASTQHCPNPVLLPGVFSLCLIPYGNNSSRIYVENFFGERQQRACGSPTLLPTYLCLGARWRVWWRCEVDKV